MNPIWIQVFKIAGGIGSGIGALSFLAVLFFQYASKREERSVSSIIGHTQLRTEDVLQILKEFKDDPKGRLKALEALLHGQREQAQQLLEKLKSGVDIEKVAQHHDQGTLKVLKPIGGVTLTLGILLLGAAFISPAPSADPTQRSAAAIPPPFQPQSGVLKIRAFVDGNDVLTVHKGTAQWTHRDNISNAPGTWQGNNATYINDVPYFPAFPAGPRKVGDSSEMKVIPVLPDAPLNILSGNSKTANGEVNVSSSEPGTISISVVKTYGLSGGARWFDIAIAWETKSSQSK
jgi:hypothetical protein